MAESIERVTLSQVAAVALRHLGLVAREVRVEQYGADTWRVGVRAARLTTELSYQGSLTAPVWVRGPIPAWDDLPAAEYERLAAAALAEIAPALETGADGRGVMDPINRVYLVESVIAALPPAAARLARGRVDASLRRDWLRYDPRIEDAARRGYERSIGAITQPLQTAEERRANRERERAGTARQEAAEAAVRAAYPGCPDRLVQSLASARCGRVRAGKLRAAIADARDALRRRPYLTADERDTTPWAVYSRFAGTDTPSPRKDTHADLLADYDAWRPAVERAIAEAEGYLSV
jgi:hypothetical protein